MMRRIAVLLLVGCALPAAAIAFVVDDRNLERDDLNAKDRERVAAITRPAGDFAAAEKFERMQAGAATTTKLVNADIFSQPSANLGFEGQQRFALGNGLFRKDWVSAPSSTRASDGLGPLFNARSCQSCHIKDGRGHAPVNVDDPAVSLLVRLSVPPDGRQEAAIAAGELPAAPDPVYGLQLQDFAVAGLPAEGRVRIEYDAVPVVLSDGEKVELRKPRLSIDNPGFGPFARGLMTSARVAPPMIGLGLIEAIHPADILAREDPDDVDGDSISGRASWVRGADGERTLGRFGWKAVEPMVRSQTAHAFAGDMGLSTPDAPNHWGDCTERQPACLAMPNGAQAELGAEEVPEELMALVAHYATNLAVPARRDENDPQVLAGKKLFYESGCVACHTPKYVTSRRVEQKEHRFQLIWPYSDFLLHDMGEDLADHRSEGPATGVEWRTPPLWGIGLSAIVNGEASYLHDGRARTLLEAVLWHGGEAAAARRRVVEMDPADRAALIRFLESL